MVRGISHVGQCTFDAVTDSATFSFRIVHAQPEMRFPIRAVLHGRRGELYLVQERPGRDAEQWLINVPSRAATQLTPSGEHPARYVYAIDGSGSILGIEAMGQFVFMDADTHSAHRGKSFPTGVTAIGGDVDKGFWLADRHGGVLFATQKKCLRVGNVNLASPHCQEILCTTRVLIWRGTCIHTTGDLVSAITVWRRTTPGCLAVPQWRVFEKQDGTLYALDYDEERARMIAVFSGGDRARHELCIGTLEEFVAGGAPVRHYSAATKCRSEFLSNQMDRDSCC